MAPAPAATGTPARTRSAPAPGARAGSGAILTGFAAGVEVAGTSARLLTGWSSEQGHRGEFMMDQ